MEDDLTRKLDEVPGFWQRLTKDHKQSLIYIKCTVLEAAREDNVIYHGLAGQLFLAEIKHVFKLQIEAPFEDRVQRTMNDLNLDEKRAVDYLLEADDKRNRWFKMIFGESWKDPSIYDLSVNLHNISFKLICTLVRTALSHDAFKTTEQSRNVLDNLLLSCEVKAAFASEDKLWNQPISVLAYDSAVTLKGMVKNKDIEQQLVETALKVKGVTSCKSNITLASNPLQGGIWRD
jgi:cytidylate kinase